MDSLQELKYRGNVYRPGYFHPVHIGELYDGRYLVLRKLGYGLYSTVWLVGDSVSQKFYAMKVLSAECYGGQKDTFEREILEHLRSFRADHPGRKYTSLLMDSFEIRGPHGLHVCLVFPVMGETFSTFGTLFARKEDENDHRVPGAIMKRFVKQLLLALDYAHSAGVIHTDIKPDNIMIQLPDETVVEYLYLPNTLMELQGPIMTQSQFQTEQSSGVGELSFLHWPNNNLELIHRRSGLTDNMISSAFMPPWELSSEGLQEFYLSADADLMQLKVALCDWGVSSWTRKHLCNLITPQQLRSPEVLTGAEWGTKTDIWNLGAIIVEIIECVQLFQGRPYPGADYDTKEHLHEIVELFGPFPQSLLERGNQWFVHEVFDDNGRVKGREPLQQAQLEDWITCLEGQDKARFMAMLRNMMKIDPEQRKSARELLDEPWLKDVE